MKTIAILLLLLFVFPVTAVNLSKQTLSEDNLQLMSVFVDKKNRARSIEGYLSNDLVLVAIEPLFDSLSLRYKINESMLQVWKEDQVFEYTFTEQADVDSQGYWGDDEYSLYIDIESLASLFNVGISYDIYRLKLDITTADYLFPIKQLEIIEKQRLLTRYYSSKNNVTTQKTPITIADQYRLFTMPNGYLDAGLTLNNDNNHNNLNIQLVSDLLYHSANLSLSTNSDSDVDARLNFARYQTSPDDPILGLFERYSFGDVSGSSNSLVTNGTSGLGIEFSQLPEYFRAENLTVTIKEVAPPNWEAELYHNGRFVLKTVVPSDGFLILEDVDVEFSSNYFQIKLFGPYGETKIIEKYYDLTKNALSAGDLAYSFYALDPEHRLINDQSDADYGLKDFGGTFDIGISNNWQLGVGFAQVEDTAGLTQQFLNFKNAFAFPGFLIQNDFSINNDGGYAQQTSLVGNAIGSDRFSLSYQSAKDFESNRVKAKDSELQQLNANYTGNVIGWRYNVNLGYDTQDDNSSLQLSNSIGRQFSRMSINHTLSYFTFDNPTIDDSVNNDSLLGTLDFGGYIAENLRISGLLSYDPRDSSLLKDNTSVLANWKYKDSFGLNHYLSARYNLVGEDKRWRLGYRLAFERLGFQYTLSSSYNSEENWNVLAGVRFFFGYDHYNQRPIFSNQLSPSMATLDAHTYLDRQQNGIPDVLDYDLENVTFSGNPEWLGLKSGETGRIILPGVLGDTPFQFSAQWQSGSRTFNNDYVVYTHPGAYVEANMPFYLQTEFGGFVSRLNNNNNETPLAKADIQLSTKNGTLISEVKTDLDGYFEFIDLKPGNYNIRISSDYMQEKGYTSAVIGYDFSTPETGGYIELDTLYLSRIASDGELDEELSTTLEFDEDSVEALVWVEDKRVKRNLFALPLKQAVAAPYNLAQGPTIAEESMPESQIAAPSVVVSEDENKLKNWVNTQAIADVNGIGAGKRVAINGLGKAVVAVRTNPQATNLGSQQTAVAATTNPPVVRLQPYPIAANQPVTAAVDLFYAIQFGIYDVKAYAEEVAQQLSYLSEAATINTINRDPNKTQFQLTYGQFLSRTEALRFAAANITNNQAYFVIEVNTDQYDNNSETAISAPLTQGWVVQLYAAATSDSWLSEAPRLLSIGAVNLATKSINGNVMYCITSQLFSSKIEAEALRDTPGVSGWVAFSDSYTSISLLPVL